MTTINLYLRSDSKDKSHGYVWVKFYVNREKVNFSLHVHAETKHWNERNCRVSSGDKEAKDKNLIIETILARINNVFVKYRLRGKKLTKAGFEKEYSRPDDYDTFFEFCDKYRRDIQGYTGAGTLANHAKALKKLKDYAPDLHFDDITYDFLKGYFLGHLTKAGELGNKLSTGYKDMSVIRKYVHAARRAGYIDDNPFKDFHIKRTEGSYTYLTEDELKRIVKLYRTGNMDPKRYKTLQLFLFMCFSSLHVGDALDFEMDQINGNSFGYFRKKLVKVKPRLVIVPISDMLRQIITDIAGHRIKGKLFTDMPAEQTMNEYLKGFCKLDSVKINKPISHKTGRHTFATFYLSKTKDLNALKDVMGHEDIRETLKYSHVLETDKKDNITCFDAFITPDPDTDEACEK